ncbi:hypothetical protein Y032_0026g1312 [Ancylostoma ceylanicum]|uniref:Band 7 domain-containing protein n=1 Tax=Ancylostoma ceylanicum TaxID=53326 RepID=A0A016UW51_9BILA|nr:hypothetical protein Y032_0026g1312 [Ancylostoma ceylanicum]
MLAKTKSIRDVPPDYETIGTVFGYALVALSWLLIILTFPFSMCVCLKVIKEYERVVIFRIGRLVFGGARGPGMIFIIPCIDTYRKIDLRVVSYAVPPQEILSKDSVTVSVDAVVYFRTSDPIASVNNVDDAIYSTKLLAQTTLRNALGMKTLTEMLTEREAIAQLCETILDEGTEHWGVKVCSVLLVYSQKLVFSERPRRVTRRCCCGGQPAQLGANPAPAPRRGHFDPIKSGVFVTSVTFVVLFRNQRGEEIKDVLISPAFSVICFPDGFICLFIYLKAAPTEILIFEVERVEVKDIRLPQQLTRAMAAEAEAAREARAKVVAAEGEQKASRALKEAADVIQANPVALQLRHLQALNSIAAEHNSTIVFPVPVEMFGAFMKKDN